MVLSLPFEEVLATIDAATELTHEILIFPAGDAITPDKDIGRNEFAAALLATMEAAIVVPSQSLQ